MKRIYSGKQQVADHYYYFHSNPLHLSEQKIKIFALNQRGIQNIRTMLASQVQQKVPRFHFCKNNKK